MKTKIVYVLTSNENDYLLEQLLLSLCSLRYHNPEAYVYLVVDQSTALTLKGDRKKVKDYLTDVIVVNTPQEYNNMLRSRWIKTSLREHIEGDYLFIDSDTVITDSFEECDTWDYNIAAVIDRHIPVDENHRYYEYIRDKARLSGWAFTKTDEKYFNSGVMYVKDNDFTHDFYALWHKYWIEGLQNNVQQDQPTLGRVNKEMKYPIVELNGIWNCQIIANGLTYLHHAKLIHYFNAERQSEKKSVIYKLSDKDLYKQIKENHFELNEKVKLYLYNGKSCFSKNYQIYADDQLKAIRDPLSEFIINSYYYNNLFRKILYYEFKIYIKIKTLLLKIK